MRIAVLADTHVNMLEQLPKKIIDTISTVDLIIHAGDFTDVQVLEELKRLKVVKAVHGNMYSMELKTTLPNSLFQSRQGYRLFWYSHDRWRG